MKKMIASMKLLVYLFFIIFFLNYVTAVGISLNPADINITDLQRGGYAEQDLAISTNGQEELNITMFLDSTSGLNDWLTFDPPVDHFVISNSKPGIIKMIVQPPEDIPNGIYGGVLRFRVIQAQKFEGRTGSVIEVGVGTKLSFEISDKELISCDVLSGVVDNAEKGTPIPFNFRIFNNGNVRLNPNIKVEVWDKSQSNLIDTINYEDTQIFPTVKDNIIVNVNTFDLDIGQYFAGVLIEECGFEDTLTFDVLKPGSITISGRLVQIENKVWNNVGDEIEVKAVFENTGEKTVSAVFKGKILLNDKLIDPIESGNIQVNRDSTVEFPLSFSPDKPGRYIIKGRVFYDNKQTFEKTTVINVNPEDIKYDGTSKEIQTSQNNYAYLIIVIILILLLLIIIKKKKSQN